MNQVNIKQLLFLVIFTKHKKPASTTVKESFISRGSRMMTIACN